MVAGLDRAMGDFVFEFDDTFMDYPFEVLDRMYDSAVERVRRGRRRAGQPRVGPAVVLRGVQLVLAHPAAAQLRAAAGVLTPRARRDAPSARADPRPAGAVPLHRVPVPAAGLPGRTGRPATIRGRACASGWTCSSRSPTPGSGSRGRSSCFFAAVSALSIVASIFAFISDRETPWELVITADRRRVGFAGLYFVPGGGRRVCGSDPRRGAEPADLHDGQDPHLDDDADGDQTGARPASRRRSGSRPRASRSRSWCASGESPRSTSGRSGPSAARRPSRRSRPASS